MASTSIFVGNLPDNVREDSLRNLFCSYGDIKDVTLVKNYGFVTFGHEDEAQKAVRELHHTKFSGRELTVEISKPRGQSRSNGPSRGRDRNNQRDDRKRSSGLALPPNFAAPPAGGILGAAPNTNLSGGLGLLSAVQAVNSVVAAASGRQSGVEMPGRSNIDNRDSNNTQKGLSDGYVIYERYYVDPDHPLLKGLPLPEIPRITDSYVSQDLYPKRSANPPREDDHPLKDFRERSPMQSRRDFDYDRERSREYNDYFDRR